MKAKNAFTPQALADRFSITKKRTVYTRIREINDLCAGVDAKPIFHKFPGDKRGLNPMLKCRL